MSINHYSQNPSSSNHKTFFSPHILIPNSTATYRPTHPSTAMFCGQSSALSFNLNNEDEESSVEDQATTVSNIRETITTSSELEQEKLFEKPLTPSDVGKLNRLVIPKQHAEKHFPLNGGSDSVENGLLLGFEDETGKPWRFRYSYWNSSQSYVLTKGWSRFVKEKRLDAGDIVLFGRHRNDFGRLFIGWRRRNSGQEGGGVQPHHSWNGVVYPAGYSFQRSSQQHEGSSSVLFQTDCPNAEKGRGGGGGNSKRLRLFGVNLEWAEDEAAEAVEPPYSSDDHHQRTWI